MGIRFKAEIKNYNTGKGPSGDRVNILKLEVGEKIGAFVESVNENELVDVTIERESE